MNVIIEPFKIKSVEPIKLTTREQRQQMLRDCGYNLFSLAADDVIIDLLTDSGTAAMSTAQWAAIQLGDESYAGSKSFFNFKNAVQELMPFKHIIPTHQGRAAERILAHVTCNPQSIIPNNTHFDTTRANFESQGAEAVDLVISNDHPEIDEAFKGNMDTAKLTQCLAEHHARVPFVMLTITNNAGGGQPVSMQNIRDVKKICDQYQKPLILDSCRFAENAYFIQQREPGYRQKSVKEITQEIFSYADGMTMSAKKDAMVNIGGWLAVNDDDLAVQLRNHLILTEGFLTYGGLAGRDLEAMAQGLKEVVDEDYLRYRVRSAEYLGHALQKIGIPIISPVGGHAVFIDAKALLPHIPALSYPGHALAVALYEYGGIRACEIGSVMFGKQPDGSERPARAELLRLALPRRVYTQSHIDYVIEVFANLYADRHKINGYQIVEQPTSLRHFTAVFAPLTNATAA